MTVRDTNGKKSVKRIPLEIEENAIKRPVATVPEAVAAMGRLMVKRTDNDLPALGQTPKFCDYANAYLIPVLINNQ